MSLTGRGFVPNDAATTNLSVTRRLAVGELVARSVLTDTLSVSELELDTIEKNGSVWSWPSVDGAPNTYLRTDGHGNLSFAPVSGGGGGGGNVIADSPFGPDGSIVVADSLGGSYAVRTDGPRIQGGNTLVGLATVQANVFDGLADRAIDFTGILSGDVVGTQSATVVAQVGGLSTATVVSGVVAANSASSSNLPNRIVIRDGSGNFSANVVSANLNGNATSATNFTGSLGGDVVGSQNATVVDKVGGLTATSVASGANLANQSTSTNQPNRIVLRDASGNFQANSVTANLVGNATSAGSFTGTLSGDVVGTQSATVVASVGGLSAASVASGSNAANSATSGSTANRIVVRDSSGSFSANVVTANLMGTATNANSAVNFTGSMFGDVTGTQSATVVSQVGGLSASTVASGASAANSATSNNVANRIVVRDSNGNFSANVVNANLAGNATSSNSAISFSGNLSGDVTGTQSSTVVSQVGGLSSTLVASGATAGNSATSSSVPGRIVVRDSNGNFAANLITANVAGNATSSNSAVAFTGSLLGDVTGTQSATVVSQVGGLSANLVASGSTAANSATSSNTPGRIAIRDSNGSFSANVVTANLSGNATSANSAGSFTGNLSGDVTGTQSLTVVNSVGGQSASSVASATVATNAASSSNSSGAIVKRDTNGDFAAGTITANLSGNATTSTSSGSANTAISFSGNLLGDVTGTQTATVVSLVGGQTSSNVAAGVVLANSSTSSNTASTIVKRDASGNFVAGIVTANLSGNATTATSFTGSLTGDVTGTQSATVVSTVGAVTAANVASGANLANASTNLNSASTIVRRDASGNFAAGTVTANLSGNATSATTATSFSGNLAGDVTGTQTGTVVATVGGQTAANVASATVASNAATNSNTASTIVKRDASGNFVAGTITANLVGNVTGNLSGNASTATSATSATSFTGSLSGDVTGTQSATVVAQVGGQSASAVASGVQLANAATSSNTTSTIVRRDLSGNFAAGTVTANLVGNVTGNLSGNATSATTAGSATTAVTSTNFTGSLSGDVTGTQSATSVALVGGQTASNVANATSSTLAATSSNVASTIVRRDGAGSFAANKITLVGNPTLATDAANKSYVDSVAASGLSAKDPAVAYADSNLVLSGLQTVDGVILVANDRVLANAQTDPVENGLWEAQSGAWTRPVDFDVGSTCGGAYVLIVSGSTYAGSSWLCDTPTAVVGTDPISFAEFSLPSNVTGANVGLGPGQVFRDKTGVTLNFRTLAPVDHATVSTSGDEVEIGTDGTSSNASGTLVARDGSGNFSAGTVTASLTGAASLNVLKSGDSMTGNLVLTGQSSVGFTSPANSNAIAIRAPATVNAPYSLDLPADAPIAGQYLGLTTNPSILTWNTVGGPSQTSRQIFVSLAGSDSNDGSFGAPFATISRALILANSISTLANPVSVLIGSGRFVEDNSGGPLQVTVDGISIAAFTLLATDVYPSDGSQPLLLVGVGNFEMTNLVLEGPPGSTSTGVVLAANTGSAIFQNVSFLTFDLALDISNTGGGDIPFLVVRGCNFLDNSVGMSIANCNVLCDSCLFGTQGFVPTPYVGIQAGGSVTFVWLVSCGFQLLDSAATMSGTTVQAILGGCSVVSCGSGFGFSSGAQAYLSGCLVRGMNSSSIGISSSGAGTRVVAEACAIDGIDALAQPQGTGVSLEGGAIVQLNSSAISDCIVGVACGTSPSDTISTYALLNGVTLSECTTQVVQAGTSRLDFFGGSFDRSSVSVQDSTNVTFAAFDTLAAGLAFGNSLSSDAQTLYQIYDSTTSPSLPALIYRASYYGFSGPEFFQPTSGAGAFSGVRSFDSDSAQMVVTGNRTADASVWLISDPVDVGNPDLVRGWRITKSGSLSGNPLDVAFSNADSSGLALRGLNTVARFNGFDNQLEFPTANATPLPTNSTAKLVWAGDTNLYRSSAGVLKTDGQIQSGSLSPSSVVVTDSSSGLSSSPVTDTELGYLSGVTSNVQTQLDSLLSESGGTLTGTLTLPAGTSVLPSLLFSGSSTGTGISAPSVDQLVLSTSGAARFALSNTGTATLSSLSTGVLHSNSSGVLSSSQVVGSDIADGTIPDVKLQTISTSGKVANSATTATSSNTVNSIVSRDSSGNFSAGTITANLAGNATTSTTSGSATNFTGSLSGDVTGNQSATVVSLVGGQTASNVASATVLANAATNSNTVSTIVKRDTSGNFSAGTITANLSGNATTATTATNFSGSLSGDVTGTQSATVVSLVGGQSAANVASGSLLANASTSSNTASTIVRRDASGNFSAGTVTANLSGNATTATTSTNFSGSLSGDVTGTQSATVVSNVGGQTASNVAVATVASNAATNLNAASTIVKRDTSGNFSAGTITANLSGNATTATTATSATTAGSATNFTGSLSGDVIGTQTATVVSTVGGVTSTNVASGANLANASTSSNTVSTIVRRDASGNFSAGTITANLSGNATTSTNSTNFTGSLSGDVTGTQSATVVSTVGGVTAANVASGANLANAATNLNTISTIVRRDASGNFSAGTITASLSGNATTATTSTNFTGSLSGDVTGTQSATVVSTVGGVTAANVASGANLANAATSSNTVSTIVRRDASGNFSAGTITASLSGNATTSTTATNFSGSLSGDVTGTQSTTVVSTVGGQTASNVAAATVLANAATNANTASTIVKRDSSGNFSAGTITANLTGTATTATNLLNASLPSANPSTDQPLGYQAGVGATTYGNVGQQRFYVYNNTIAQAIGTGDTVILHPTKTYDPSSMYNTSTGVATIPADGFYLMGATTYCTIPAYCRIDRNGIGAASALSWGSLNGVSTTTVGFYLNAGDTIRVICYSTSSGATTLLLTIINFWMKRIV